MKIYIAAGWLSLAQKIQEKLANCWYQELYKEALKESKKVQFPLLCLRQVYAGNCSVVYSCGAELS